MNKLAEYIKNNKKPVIREEKQLPHVNVLYKGQLPKGISFDYVFDEVTDKIPKKLFSDIKHIIIGDFDFLNKKNLNSLYHDNKLYISNKERNDESVLRDIIHEIAHSLEKKHEDEIYGDKTLQHEFINKRRRLFNQMSPYYPECHNFDFDDINYSDGFDKFLYKTVTYPKLSRLASGLFFTPYATTSLREYFADGFENYILFPEVRKDIYMMCPQLYKKIRKLVDDKNY